MDNIHNKFPGLEWCRFLCALVVIIHHYRFVAPNADDFASGGHSLLRVLLTAPLSEIYANGDLAVQVFWVISGFIFYSKYANPIHEKKIDARTFFIWRFSRLYPLHFFTLIVVAFLQSLYALNHGETFVYGPNDLNHFLLQTAFASNWFTLVETFNGPIWSVSAEIVAYFVFFVVLRLSRPSAFLCLAIVATTIWFHSPIPGCMALFFAGGLLQIGFRRLDLAARRFTFFAAVAVVAEVVVVTLWRQPPNGASALFLALAIVAGSVALEDIMPLNPSIASTFGGMTYSLYLVAFPVLLTAVLVADWTHSGRRAFQSFPALAAMLAVSIAVAYAVRRAIEIPAQNAIRRGYIRVAQSRKTTSRQTQA